MDFNESMAMNKNTSMTKESTAWIVIKAQQRKDNMDCNESMARESTAG